MSVILDALARAQGAQPQRAPIGPDAMALLSAEIAALRHARERLRRCRNRNDMLDALDAMTQAKRDEFSAMASAHCAHFLDSEFSSPQRAPLRSTPPDDEVSRGTPT